MAIVGGLFFVDIAVTATSGEARAAADSVVAGRRARTLRVASVTAESYPVATVVCLPS